MSKKPIGYSKKDRDEMKTLIERTEPKSGDYVGSGTVTQVPKKKKMKRMQMGGMAGGQLANPAITGRPISRPEVALNPADSRPFGRGLEGRRIPVRGGGGVLLQGPGGIRVKPPRPGKKDRDLPRMREKMNFVPGTPIPVPKVGKMDFGPGTRTQIGGGKMIPGSRGVSNSPGRISPDYAKTRAGVSPITQIESNTLAGIRPDPVSGRPPTPVPRVDMTAPRQPGQKGYVRPDPVSGRQPTPVPRVDMTAPRQPGQKGYGMKGGGLARKGVGMALAKGGLVKANGCAQRGKTKGRMM